MSYPIDPATLRLVGDLLASGRGRLTLDSYRKITGLVSADATTTVAEMAAIAVITLATLEHSEPDARAKLLTLLEAIRDYDARLEPWVLANVNRSTLQHGVALVAGHGKRKVTRDELKAFVATETQNQLTQDEQRALLVAFEWLHGRLTPDAQALADQISAAIVQGGTSLGPGTSGSTTSGGGQPGGRRSGGGQQCGACAGTGTVTCGSCGGRGYQSYQRSRQRSDGSREHYQENISCSCSAGRLRCTTCGGTGRRP